jgi:hypothetical protein
MTLKLRKRSLFPALVTAGSPILLTKNGARYDFSFDVDALPDSLDAIYMRNSLTLPFSGAVSRSVESKLGDVVSILDFGAVGDGSVSNAATNATALTNALATGKSVFIPWTTSGYHFGANQIAVGDGQSVIGENNVLLKSTASTSLFYLKARFKPTSIRNVSFDMAGAGSSSSAITLATNPGGSPTPVAFVNISDISASNCYCVINDESGGGYAYKLMIQRVYTTLSLGTQIKLSYSQGFVFLRDIDVDCTIAGQTLVTWPSIQVTKFAGIFLEDVFMTGQSATLGSYQANATGIVIGSIANASTFAWLKNVRAESAQGAGIIISNINFVYGDLIESFGSIGNAVSFGQCSYMQLSNVYGRGFKGLTGAVANAHGVVFDTCGQNGSGTRTGGIVVSNLTGEQNTGNAVIVKDTMGLQASNIRAQDNTGWGIQETQTVAGYTNYNTFNGVDAFNNTAGYVSLLGGSSYAPLYLSSGARHTMDVAVGGTGLSSGTSGGILGYTAANVLASSALLTQYGVLFGGGAGALPSATAQGAAGKVLTGNGAAAPTFQSINQIVPFTGNPGAAGGTTLYAFLSGSTTEGIAQGISPLSGTLSKLYVSVTTAPGVGNTITATLRVNGSDTAVTCTISGTSTTASDLTHTAAITAGQPVSVKMVYSAGAAASYPSGGLMMSNP